MDLTGRDYFKTFTILGLSMCAFEGLNYLGSVIYRGVLGWILLRRAGAWRLFSVLFTSGWTSTLVQYVFAFGLSYAGVFLIVRRLPAVRGRGGRLGADRIAVLFLISMGLGYVFNILGSAVNIAVSAATGKLFTEMNPVIGMMDDMTPSMIVYACLLGPFMEELMFRGILLSRARRFGDRTAVVFCAVLFGLMHGNLAQFLYATAVGLVFGYVAVTSGALRYNVLLHMMLNSYSTLLVLGEKMIMRTSDWAPTLPLLGYSVGILAAAGLFVISAVRLLIKYWRTGSRELSQRNGPPSSCKKYVYLNPGFLLFAGICLLEMAYYLLL